MVLGLCSHHLFIRMPLISIFHDRANDLNYPEILGMASPQ
jgi:hypothetical protein